MTGNDPDRSRTELARALAAVPAYADWRALDPGPDASVDARYAALPATTKPWMRQQTFRRLVAAGIDLTAALADEDVEIVVTSGTNDVPTQLLWCQDWWDDSERASYTLNAHAAAITAGDHRDAILASPRCVGPGMSDRPQSMHERTLDTFLFINEDPDVARWTDDTVRRMADELERFAPRVLEADPWYLAALCAHAERIGVRLRVPDIVIFTYTLPSKLHLARIARAMPVPMASSYGSTETGYVFMSCEHGRLHQSVAYARVDLVPVRSDVGDPRMGKLLVTPLGNPWMSLLRFDVGDIALPATEPCPCGRTDGMLLDRIEGRIDDATLRTDGRLVTAAALDDAVAAVPSAENIVSYQLDQTDRSTYLFRALAAGAFDAERIRRALCDLYGPGARVAVETAGALLAEPSGKYLRARVRFAVDRDAWFAPTAPAAR